MVLVLVIYEIPSLQELNMWEKCQKKCAKRNRKVEHIEYAGFN
jgi:hypothetical protein